MSVVLITGAAGLIGSESAIFFAGKGFDVVGIDNDMRRYFFGDDGSTAWRRTRLEQTLGGYRHVAADIRDEAAMTDVFARYGRDIALVIHAAAQPCHDWAAREPLTDFTVNANGTLVAAGDDAPPLPGRGRSSSPARTRSTATRRTACRSSSGETRWAVAGGHPFAVHGIDETMSIDAHACTASSAPPRWRPT